MCSWTAPRKSLSTSSTVLAQPAARASSPPGTGVGLPCASSSADDSLLTRAGIVASFGRSACEVVAEARDGAEALAAVRLHRPDVAVLDIRMPPTHTDEGLVAAHEIQGRLSGTAVLVLSQYVEPAYAMRLIETYPGGLATCSRSGSSTRQSCWMRFAGSSTASVSSTRRSSPGSCTRSACPTRSTS